MSILREIITKLTVQVDQATLARFQGAITQTKDMAKDLAMTVAGIAASAGLAAAGLAGLGREGADAAQISAAYEELGGTLADLEKFRGVTGGLVSDVDIKRAMNLGKLFKIPQEQIPALMKIAQGSAVALGTSVSKNLDDVFTAMARGSVMIADNLGTQMGSVEDINKAYAKQHRLNEKTLTDEQKKQAFVDAFVEKSQRQLKLAEKATQNTFALADAAAKNLRAVFADMAFRLSSVLLKDTLPALKEVTTRLVSWWQAGNNADSAIRRVLGGLKLISTVLTVIVAIKLAVFLKAAVMLTLAWAKATWAAVAALGAAKIALIAIPVILATMALLIEDIIVWAEGGDSAIGAFIDRFAESDSVLGRLARWLRDHKDQLVNGARAIADGFFWFVGAVKSAGPAVLNTLRAAWDKVQAFFNGGAQGIIAALGQGLAAAMGQLWAWIKAPFVALGEKISGWVSDLMGIEVVARIVEAVSSVFASVRSVLGSIWSVVEETAKGFYEAFGPLLPAVIALFKALGQLAWALIKLAIAAAQIIWAVWSLKGKVIWAVIKAMAPHIWALIKRIVSFIADAIGKVAGWVGTAATWLAEKIGWAVENVVKPALAWITEAIGWLAEKAAWVAGILAEVFGWLGEKIAWVAGIAAEVATWLAEKITWVAEKVAWFAGEVAAVVTWVAEKVGWLAGKIAEGVGLVASGLAYILNTYITPAINWLTSGVDTVTAVFKDIAEGIKGMFTSAFDAVMTMAQPVIDIIDGLKGTVDWAANKLGLGDDSPAGIDQGVGQIKAFQSQLGASGGFGLGFSGAMGAASNTTSVGQVNVVVQGSTNMGPGDLSRATQQGVEAGMQNKEAARDLSVGGG